MIGRSHSDPDMGSRVAGTNGSGASDDTAERDVIFCAFTDKLSDFGMLAGDNNLDTYALATIMA